MGLGFSFHNIVPKAANRKLLLVPTEIKRYYFSEQLGFPIQLKNPIQDYLKISQKPNTTFTTAPHC